MKRRVKKQKGPDKVNTSDTLERQLLKLAAG